jgi:DNA-binding CsgD family transcriptional regulator
MTEGVAQNMRLTLRESAVLRLLARGRTYAQAGEELGISLHTVTTHIKSAYRKLQVHSAAAAVMRAVELGLLGEDASSPEHGMGGGGGGP